MDASLRKRRMRCVELKLSVRVVCHLWHAEESLSAVHDNVIVTHCQQCSTSIHVTLREIKQTRIIIP